MCLCTRKYREGALEEMVRIEREVTKSTVHLRREQALDVMRDFRNHKITAKAAATKLLHIRRWVSVQSDPYHPYSTLSSRLHRLATLLMGEQWVKEYYNFGYAFPFEGN